MIASINAGFCKNEDCPTSQDLVEFEAGDLSGLRSKEIGKHLTTCEFCSAEADFYSHYPQGNTSCEVTEPSDIPAPLYELAEAILKNRHHDPASLNSLLNKKGDLVPNKG